MKVDMPLNKPNQIRFNISWLIVFKNINCCNTFLKILSSPLRITNMQILSGASVGLGIMYKVFTSWTSPMGLTALNAFHLGTFGINLGTQHWVSLVAGK